jgi:hypothetical protein
MGRGEIGRKVCGRKERKKIRMFVRQNYSTGAGGSWQAVSC